MRRQAELWKGPTTVGGGYTRDKGKVGHERPTLAGQAQLWAAPTASPNAYRETPESFDERREKAKKLGGRPRGESTGQQATRRMWPAPKAKDYRTPTAEPYSARGGKAKGEDLSNFVVHGFTSPLSPTTTSDGAKSSRTLRASPLRLNPVFVAWLMGWPLTALGISPCSEMAWFPSRRQWRSLLLRLFSA